MVDLTTRDKVGLVLPIGASLAAPEIGPALVATRGFAFNADGSLDQVDFEDQDPLLVAGQRLWNTVQGTYDPATYGQRRHRRVLTVRGSLTSQDTSAGGGGVIRSADSQVTAAP